jgi:hypothetical protein
MSRRRTGKDSVTVEMMLHCLLRWFAGGSYLDQKLSTGISQAAFYHYIYKCMDAISDSQDLAYEFSETEQELNKEAQGFAALSSHGAIKGCVACLDGLLLQIKYLQRMKQAMSRRISLGTIRHKYLLYFIN